MDGKKETSLSWKQEKNNNHTVLSGSVKRGIKESQKQQERKSLLQSAVLVWTIDLQLMFKYSIYTVILQYLSFIALAILDVYHG